MFGQASSCLDVCLLSLDVWNDGFVPVKFIRIYIYIYTYTVRACVCRPDAPFGSPTLANVLALTMRFLMALHAKGPVRSSKSST